MMTSTQATSEMTIEAIGSHHWASWKKRRIGIDTGDENGTYDMIVITSGLSLKKITRKYGIITMYMIGAITELRSSWRETIAPVAANSVAISRNPVTKNSANHSSGVPSPARISV